MSASIPTSASADQQHAFVMQNVQAAVSYVLKSNFDASSQTCLRTCLTLTDNIIKKPYDRKVQSIRLSNSAIQSKVVSCTGGLELLQAIGFQSPHPSSSLVAIATGMGTAATTATESLSLETTNTGAIAASSSLFLAIRTLLVQVLQKELGVPASKLPSQPTPPPSTSDSKSNFNVYQPHRTDQLSSSVGANLNPPQGYMSQTERKVYALMEKQRKVVEEASGSENSLTVRWNRAWRDNNGNGNGNSNGSNNDNSAMDMGTKSEDSKLLQAQYQQKVLERKAQENQGMTTKAMREMERLQKQKVYPSAVLRIQFPDGSGIFGECSSRTTIQQIMNSLTDEVLMIHTGDPPKSNSSMALPSFELFTTPPRTILASEKSLTELQLVPAAKIHIRWTTPLPLKSSSKNPQAGWFIQSKWFETSPSLSPLSTLPSSNAIVVPKGIPLVGDNEKPSHDAGKPRIVKKKKSKSEKEALMLKRMLGK